MKEQLEKIYSDASIDIEKAVSVKDLEDIKFKYLSRKGEFNEIKKGLKDLSPDDKRIVGSLANDITQKLESAISEKFQIFYEQELNKKLEKEKIDVTLPGQYVSRGHVHPLTSTTNEIVSIFQSLGFSVAPNENSPEVETEYFNFDMLNVPKEHPAREMQDTFYIDKETVLRTHTSAMQVRTMESQQPPIKMISTGNAYRIDEVDATHSPIFGQLEILVVDKDVTMADLIGTLESLIKHLLGEKTKIRVRPSYFPFTEPSIEVDAVCPKCGGKGCSLCKDTGFIEMLGAGMVHPKVLEMSGVDSTIYKGFAAGIGLDRLVMMKSGVSDLRDLYENDINLLKQFK